MTLRIVHGLAVMLTIAMLAAVDPASAGPPPEQLRVQMATPVEREQFVIIHPSGYPSLVNTLTEKPEQGLEADREPAIRKASQAK